jgi:hypothetical protein
MNLPALRFYAGAKLVAQILNLLYRRFVICEARDISKRSTIPTPADYKSAIQQIRNLRYSLG